MVSIRNKSALSAPRHEKLGLNLSTFHKNFLESVDQPKVSTNPSTKLLSYYENKRGDTPNSIFEMMNRHPEYAPGSPEYKFIYALEDDVIINSKAFYGIKHLKNFAPKPQEAGGGGRVDFFKFLLNEFHSTNVVNMYADDISGDKSTLVYALHNGVISESRLPENVAENLHKNASINFRSERFEQNKSDDSVYGKEEQNEDNNKPNNLGVSKIEINGMTGTGTTDAEALKNMGNIINHQRVQNIDENLTGDFSITVESDTTVVHYNNYTTIESTLPQALKSIGKQISDNSVNPNDEDEKDDNEFWSL